MNFKNSIFTVVVKNNQKYMFSQKLTFKTNQTRLISITVKQDCSWLIPGWETTMKPQCCRLDWELNKKCQKKTEAPHSCPVAQKTARMCPCCLPVKVDSRESLFSIYRSVPQPFWHQGPDWEEKLSFMD